MLEGLSLASFFQVCQVFGSKVRLYSALFYGSHDFTSKLDYS